MNENKVNHLMAKDALTLTETGAAVLIGERGTESWVK